MNPNPGYQSGFFVKFTRSRYTCQVHFQGDENIIRCHKSFIVNRNEIETVNGNARSLFLMMKARDIEIPVSHSFP